MTTDGGGGSTNPYQSATDQNTSTTWLNNMTPVDVHIKGLVDYATNMVTIADNLSSHKDYVMNQLSSLPQQALGQSGFPEAAYTLELCMQNFGEFSTYLAFLNAGLQNIGNAAQTVADCYNDTDGWSSADLNAVNFAFGDPSATRPGGLPSIFGKTWQQAYDEQQAKDQAAAQQGGGPASDHQWHVVSTGTYDNGGGYTIFEDQYGNTRSVNVTYVDGKKVTFLNDPTGTTEVTESTVTYPYGSVTTTTTVGPDGKTSTSSKDVSYSHTADGGYVTTTSTVNQQGQVTSSTVQTTHPDGTVTTSTESYDNGKPTVTSQVTVGADNPAPGASVDSPAADAINQVKNG